MQQIDDNMVKFVLSFFFLHFDQMGNFHVQLRVDISSYSTGNWIEIVKL